MIEASGLEARVIQHEIDHLDGVLILDRTSREQRKEAMRALREAAGRVAGLTRQPRAHRLPRHHRVRRGGARAAGGLAAPPRAGRHPPGPPARPRPAAGPAAGRRDRRASSGSSSTSPSRSTTTTARARIAAAAPEAVCVCAFGALIKEPLLSEHGMLNVHPSLLPRWRGAAPIERAIMAGDERTGVSIMRADRRARQRPGVPAGRRADPARRHYGTLAERLQRARRRAAGAGARRAARRAPSRTTRWPPTPRRSPPRTARSTRLGRAAELERVVRALTPAHRRARRRSPTGPRSGVREARAVPPDAGGRAAGDGLVRRRRCRCSGAPTARSSCWSCSRPGAGAMAGADYLRGRRGARTAEPSRDRRPARACAFAVMRRVFEQGAYADRALAAEAGGLDARDRALAMALAYGAVQRRGDARPRRSAARSAGRCEQLDPPVLAALRLGLFQILYLDGIADHAAVNESVELAKRRGPRRRGLVNAVLRRAAREGREIARRRCDDATPDAAALLHSVPSGWRELWWRRARRRATRARCWRRSTSPPSPRCASTRSSPTPARWRAAPAGAVRAGARDPGGARARGAVRRPGLGAVRRRRDHAPVARLDAGRARARPVAGRARARPVRGARAARPRTWRR